MLFQHPHVSGPLRALLNDPSQIIVAPGVYDGIPARLALNAGFKALYMTGAGTSMSALGVAGLGLATMTEMKQNAEMIANLDRSVPVIADAVDGGADVASLEAISSREELEACARFKGKAAVMYGMVQGSNAYKITVQEAHAIGVHIIVYAAVCLPPSSQYLRL